MSSVFRVPIRKVRNALDDLEKVNLERFKNGLPKILQDDHYHQCFCWATAYAGATSVKLSLLKEKQDTLLANATNKHFLNLKHTLQEKGVSTSAHFRHQKMLVKQMNFENMKAIRSAYKQNKISRSSIKTSIFKLSIKKKGDQLFCYRTKKLCLLLPLR